MPTPDPLLNPGAYQRYLYTSTFQASVAAGDAQPLLVPYSLFGPFIVPVLYLCLPHTRRPWLYRARYATVVAMVALNANIVSSGTSSTNMAAAYATGLMVAWSTMWGITLLVWMRPQFEAARVEKRRKPQSTGNRRAEPGARPGGKLLCSESGGEKDRSIQTPPDESVATQLGEYEYYWQPYPEKGTFLERLDWVVDLVTAFRGSGWNWAISSIPHFRQPRSISSCELVQMDTIPLVTPAGYVRSPTYCSFLLSRAWHMTWGYLVLDLCSVCMMKDPYFIFGPDATDHPLPPYLAALPPWALEVHRSVLAFAGILGALFMILSADQLFRCAVLGPRIIGVRGELWHHASLFGSFDNVLDKGLAGFWGAWWHQSFRVGFTAPTTWLTKHGYLDPNQSAVRTQLVGLFIAFGQSSLLHVAGGLAVIPNSPKLWTPAVFFMLSFGGIVLQLGLYSVFKQQLEPLPRTMKRAGNLLYVIFWLHLTRSGLIDDMCRSGIWLYEPVPASPLRAMGFGKPGDSWWRWDRHHFPSWHTGTRWWESGIAI